jgi:spore coat protein CotF
MRIISDTFSEIAYYLLIYFIKSKVRFLCLSFLSRPSAVLRLSALSKSCWFSMSGPGVATAPQQSLRSILCLLIICNAEVNHKRTIISSINTPYSALKALVMLSRASVQVLRRGALLSHNFGQAKLCRPAVVAACRFNGTVTATTSASVTDINIEPVVATTSAPEIVPQVKVDVAAQKKKKLNKKATKKTSKPFTPSKPFMKVSLAPQETEDEMNTLAGYASRCIRKKQVQQKDLDRLTEGMRSDKVKLGTLLKVAQCMRFLQPADVASANPVVNLIAYTVREVCNHNKIILPLRTLCELLMSLKHLHSNDRKEVGQLLTLLAEQLAVSADTANLEGFHLCGALYGLRRMSSDSPEVCSVLAAISPHIEKCSKPFDAQAVANALYGLQGMNSDVLEVQTILSALTPQVIKCTDLFGSQAVGNALYGLRQMNSHSPQVRAMLSALTPHVASCFGPLDGQAVGISLYGLQRMSSDHPEVRALLAALCPHIVACKKRLDAQAVGNALYGLQGMSSDVEEVQTVLMALAPLFAACREGLMAQEVGNALFGLQRMSSDEPIVCRLLTILCHRIKTCKEKLTAQHASNALLGLQNMNSDSPEVRKLLAALTPKLAAYHGDMNALAVVRSVHSLRNMSSDALEVCTLLAVLTPKVVECRENLSARSASLALCGLQRMSSESEEVRQLLAFLASKFELAAGDFDVQCVSDSLTGLKSMSSDCIEVRAVLAFLLPLIKSCSEKLSEAERTECIESIKYFDASTSEVGDVVSALALKDAPAISTD